LDLERQISESQRIVGLKDLLRKFIPDLDLKLEDELTREMLDKIDEKFGQLQQRV